ncbi:hypothetical protein U1Q18_038929 [Sarracenia purpurea var. burkii]
MWGESSFRVRGPGFVMNGLDASCNLGCVGGSSPNHVLQGMERENLEVAEMVSQVGEIRCGFNALVQEVGHHVEGMGLGGGSGVPCAGEGCVLGEGEHKANLGVSVYSGGQGVKDLDPIFEERVSDSVDLNQGVKLSAPTAISSGCLLFRFDSLRSLSTDLSDGFLLILDDIVPECAPPNQFSRFQLH